MRVKATKQRFRPPVSIQCYGKETIGQAAPRLLSRNAMKCNFRVMTNRPVSRVFRTQVFGRVASTSLPCEFATNLLRLGGFLIQA